MNESGVCALRDGLRISARSSGAAPGKEWISLPKGKGIKLTNTEDRAKRMA